VQDELAWICTGCGQAVFLDEMEGLKPVEVHYAASIRPETTGRPFWVADGRATLARETYSGNQDREAQGFWSQPRRFYIPAFECNMDTLLQSGIQLLAQPPDCLDGPQVRFLPVVLSPVDAHAAAEFIVVAVEAGRKDKMKAIQFKLELSEPVLWILP
jgi:hypothetical protein